MIFLNVIIKQVIKRRFGTYSHVVLIVVALIVNLLVAGVVKMEGVQILSSLTQREWFRNVANKFF
jgi:hypothetical protein